MMSTTEFEKKIVSRRKLVGWLGILSVFTAVGAAVKPWSKKKSETVKLLTQDGTLVEVNVAQLSATGKKLSNKEMQNWVSNKSK